MTQPKITKIKERKKRKSFANKKSIRSSCPYCLSRLETNEVGVIECKGDKLKLWEAEIVKFHSLKPEDKTSFLKKLSDETMFIELYERWERAKKSGNPNDFSCVYTNRLFNPITKIRTSMADPIFVAKIEKSLGRKLTEEELRGEVELWREGNRFFSDYRKGRVKVRIPTLIFPDSFL